MSVDLDGFRPIPGYAPYPKDACSCGPPQVSDEDGCCVTCGGDVVEAQTPGTHEMSGRDARETMLELARASEAEQCSTCQGLGRLTGDVEWTVDGDWMTPDRSNLIPDGDGEHVCHGECGGRRASEGAATPTPAEHVLERWGPLLAMLGEGPGGEP